MPSCCYCCCCLLRSLLVQPTITQPIDTAPYFGPTARGSCIARCIGTHKLDRKPILLVWNAGCVVLRAWDSTGLTVCGKVSLLVAKWDPELRAYIYVVIYVSRYGFRVPRVQTNYVDTQPMIFSIPYERDGITKKLRLHTGHK